MSDFNFTITIGKEFLLAIIFIIILGLVMCGLTIWS
jgi:hypothetical protein